MLPRRGAPEAPQRGAKAVHEHTALLRELHRTMLLIRRFEEAAAKAYSQGRIGGFLHLYIGQEASAVGALSALGPEDYIVGTYRDHGLALARGMSARACMAELYGKATGCSRGMGGSMHFFDASRKMMGGYGIVGGHVPLAAGMAFASKYRKEKGVTLCFLGEGAVSIGDFHEALSLAALWHLPLVVVVENNEYAMGTPLERTLSVADVSLKALAYGMARDRFRADDVLTVREHFQTAVQRAREESLPTLLEVQTYRYRGHSMSDPGKYRTAEEVEARKRNDCVHRAELVLQEWGVTEEELQAVGRSVEAEVEDAVRFAEESPEPSEELIEALTYA
ncbi:MAG: pyruvate dehydrogenase (acetyl-transferring) E1 component subunit alpha [Deltaproteobacteria bacterium]|nr:pyruvate dehydrogenase (acetyl-transferring) E1 component subunit alpha [Deltaproteobacteria bacterium]